MPIISPENVELVVVHNCTMRVAWTRTCLWICYLLKWPFVGVDAVSMEVIDPVEAIVSPKDINLSLVDDRSVAISSRGRWVVYW